MALSNIDRLSEPFAWPEEGVTRVPFRLFSDAEIYALEQERIFRGAVWCFLGLDIDIPNPGDYKTTTVGEIPVVVTRGPERSAAGADATTVTAITMHEARVVHLIAFVLSSSGGPPRRVLQGR